MTDARAHEPKLAALRAHADGALRPLARARLERHLATCATCSEALRGLHAYRTLATASADDVPAIDWARIDSALRSEATRATRRRRARTLAWVGAGLAAATWLAIALRPHAPVATNEAPRPVPVAPAQESPAPAPQLRAVVTALVGSAHLVDAAHGDAAVTLDSVPLEGWTLETGSGSEVHVALAETGAFVLRENSRLTLRTLRPGQVELALARGMVVNQVLPRQPGQRYEVLANERRVRVHGTRFGVEAAPASLAVQVDEGVVQVLDNKSGALLAELRAPQRWVQEGETAGRLRRIGDRLPHPRQLALENFGWPVLVVPTWNSVVQWQIDGADTAAGGQLQMRVPPGKVRVVGRLADGRLLRGERSVDALGARFDPSELRLVPSGSAGSAAPPPDSLDSDSASAVIRGNQPALQRCYERSMRGQAPGTPSIVRVRLRIEIDARGGVRTTELADGEAAPPDLAACIRQVARSWHFSAPGGGGVTFEAPLRFRPLH